MARRAKRTSRWSEDWHVLMGVLGTVAVIATIVCIFGYFFPPGVK